MNSWVRHFLRNRSRAARVHLLALLPPARAVLNPPPKKVKDLSTAYRAKTRTWLAGLLALVGRGTDSGKRGNRSAVITPGKEGGLVGMLEPLNLFWRRPQTGLLGRQALKQITHRGAPQSLVRPVSADHDH